MIVSFSRLWQEEKEREMVDINQGECGAGLLATFPSHCRL